MENKRWRNSALGPNHTADDSRRDSLVSTKGSGKFLKPRIILSGVNFVEAGPLAVFSDALQTLSKSFLDNYEVIALVHRRELCDFPGIVYLEFPQVKSSWLRRLYFEYVQCLSLSRELDPYLWLSMHDITANVVAQVRAVYCHNPSPFYDLPLKETFVDLTFTVFCLFYRFLYGINIAKNDFVIVQQDWLRMEFRKRYPVRTVVVAHPSIPSLAVEDTPRNLWARSHYLFFYPALARPFKNFELLLEAAKCLESRGVAEFRLRLTIDGSENRYAASLRERFDDLETVEWLGHQTRARVEDLYQQVDCLLFPSKLETWGMPISEWKRTKKPMLVADLPYAHETVGDYHDVSFINIQSSEALASTMEHVLRRTAKFSGSQSEVIAEPFACDWHRLFTILLEKAGNGAAKDRTTAKQTNAESGAI